MKIKKYKGRIDNNIWTKDIVILVGCGISA